MPTPHTEPSGALRLKAREDPFAADKPQLFRENVLWINETKIEFFGNAHQQFVYRQQNEAYKEKNTLPTVTRIMKSEDYQRILERNVL